MCFLISFLRFLFEKIKLDKDTLLNNLQKANNTYTDSSFYLTSTTIMSFTYNDESNLWKHCFTAF